MSPRRGTSGGASTGSARGAGARARATKGAGSPRTPSPAATDAAAQLKRLLLALPRLADDAPHSLADVARAAGTDADTLVRDLRTLVTRVEEVPGAFIDGVQLFLTADEVALTSTMLRRPMRLSLGELRALELGLALLAQERGPEERPVLEAARARLAQATARVVAEEQAQRQLRGARLADVTPPWLELLRSAVRDRRVVALTYAGGSGTRVRADGAGSEADSTRTVRPYGTVAARGKWYLVGFCEHTDAIRVFRVDRVRDAALTEQRFTVPHEFSLEQVLQGDRVFTNPSPGTLRVRYGPRIARWIAEREGRAPDADGSITVEHPLADEAWAVRHVLQYGPDAEVLEPASVRAQVVDAVRGLLDAS